MERGDDRDRPRRPDPGETWQTGNHRRARRRADEDPPTRRHGRPDDAGGRRGAPDDASARRRRDDEPAGRPAPDDGGRTRRTASDDGSGRYGSSGDGRHTPPDDRGPSRYGPPDDDRPTRYGPPGDGEPTRYAATDGGPTRRADGGGGRHGGDPRDGGPTRVTGDPGATRQMGDGGATRRVGDPDGFGATRLTGAPNDPGATRHMGGGDPGATRRVAGAPMGDGPTRRMAGPSTRMLPSPIAEPELLGGRYRLEGLVGQGGMADVHRATDTRLNRPVAVKIFGPGNDPSADRRFQQEAQVMANLAHPGLVAVHDFAVEPTRAYLVMELVDGPTLREVIENEQLPAEDIRRYGVEVAQALDYVHGQGVTHRDVKPSNILIGSDGRARIADFGVASLLGSDGHTAAGEIVGTPAYLAPEQILGGRQPAEPAGRGQLSGDVGPPADVYALGLVLLEAWTGRQEYQGEGLEGASERLTRSPVIPRDLPEPLRASVTAMTATDQRRRPSAGDAADMLSDLGPPEPAPVVEPDVEPREPGSSGAGKWIAIGAFVVALLVLLIGFLLYSNSDSGTPAAPETTTSERTTTTEAPTSENDGPGFSIPSNIPTGLPSGIPTAIPSGIPTGIPDLPSNLPDPGQIGDDAKGFWDQVSDWWKSLTG